MHCALLMYGGLQYRCKTVSGHVQSIKVTFAGCVTSASQDFCVIGGGWNVVYMVGYSEYSALFFDLCVVHLKIGLLQEEAINNEFCFLPHSVATLVVFPPLSPLFLLLPSFSLPSDCSQ